MESAAGIIEKMEQCSKWLILCHENPDGDTLGCGLALYLLAERLGKSARIIGKDPMPLRYSFLPMSENYETVPEITEKDAEGHLIICVDTSNPERSVPGLSDVISCAVSSINIDHHGDNCRYCHINMIDSDASATAELLTNIILSGGLNIEKNEAVCLYTALSTDNGNFRFNSTTPNSHICAAKLLAAGAKPSLIDDRINENMSQGALKLWGSALSRTEISAGGKCAVFWLTREDFETAGVNISVAEGLVNMLLRIVGVKAAILVTETALDNKISIRTREPYSARDIAGIFGGGGHVHAAGAKISGPFADALKKIRIEAEKHVSNRPASA